MFENLEAIKMKVLITDYNFPSVDIEGSIIKDFGAELFVNKSNDSQNVLSIAENCDALITQYYKIDSDFISSLKNCQIIVTYGIGTNAIDLEAASKKKIIVSNVPDYGVQEVSDHAMSLLLSLYRKLFSLDCKIRNGSWGYKSIVPIKRLSECTLGVIGFGRIAQLFVTKAKAFQFKEILVYDPYVSESIILEYGAESADLDTITTASDYISLHAPLNDETKHMINEKRLSKMKSNAFIINAGRGPLIDEKALVKALDSGWIAGAGLDVFEEEPLPKDSPLLKLKNVILSPHCAWYSEQALKDLQVMAAEEVVRVLGGEKPRSAVNLYMIS
jgi:D-3-phosphoglycerate dehydrogenase / 2-oxoglutarate reductase